MKKRVKAPTRFSHLNPALRVATALPDSERVMHIRADRWIGYPRAIATLAHLEALLHWPRKQRMPNLLLIGPTNNGKSMIIEKFLRGHRAAGTDADRESVPVVSVQMPSDPSISRFYAMLLAALGAPLLPRMRTQELEHQALALLRAVGTRLLIIDELHNILAGPMRLQLEFLNLIRFLGNESKIPSSASARRRRTLPSARTVSSRTASSRWRCRCGRKVTRCAPCYRASLLPIRCAGHPSSEPRTLPAFCSPGAKGPLANSPSS